MVKLILSTMPPSVNKIWINKPKGGINLKEGKNLKK